MVFINKIGTLMDKRFQAKLDPIAIEMNCTTEVHFSTSLWTNDFVGFAVMGVSLFIHVATF